MLLGTLIGCGGDSGRTQDAQVQISDSAGVRIVEYAGQPAVEPPFALAAEPLYRHGANPGDYESCPSTPAGSSRMEARSSPSGTAKWSP